MTELRWFGALAAAAVLVGCSGSGTAHGPATTSAGRSGTTSVPASTATTLSVDDATLARNIRMQATDLPAGWQAAADPKGPLSARVAIFEVCGAKAMKSSGEPVLSSGFANASGTTWGVAVVTSSPTVAAQVFAAFNQPAFEACAQAALSKSLTTPINGAKTTVAAVPFPPVGTKSDSYTVTVAGRVADKPSSMLLQLAWAQVGRVVVGAVMEAPTTPDQNLLKAELQAMAGRVK